MRHAPSSSSILYMNDGPDFLGAASKGRTLLDTCLHNAGTKQTTDIFGLVVRSNSLAGHW